MLALAVDRLGGAVVEIDRARDAVDGEVRVDRADDERAVELARVQLEAQIVARAEDVLLLDRSRERKLVGRGEAGSERKIARGLFLDRHGEVNLVGRAGHLGAVDVDLAEVSEPVDSVARELDLATVVPRRLELPELAPDDFVARARVAGDVDPPHVDAPLWLGHQRHRHAGVVTVDFRARIDLRESVAEGAEAIDESASGLGHCLGAIGLARLHHYQRAEVFFLAEIVALEPDSRDRVQLAFLDVDGDRDVLLVGRDRDLRRLDLELEVAAVLVVRAQRFEVGVELGARVAVALQVEVEPGAVVELEQALQRAFRERLVADDADFADLRRPALGHRERDIDAIALLRRDGGDDLGTVEAAGEVLTLELLLGSIGQRLVERQTLTDAEVFQRLDQRVFLELLHADEIDVGDDRALVDDDHGDAVVDVDAHVLEQAGSEQGAQCGSSLLVGVRVANAKRQGREHGAGVAALQPFDTDVFQHEGFDRERTARMEHESQRDRYGSETEAKCARGRAGETLHAVGHWRPSRRAMSL